MKKVHIDHLNKIAKRLFFSIFNHKLMVSDEFKEEKTPHFKTTYLIQIGLLSKKSQLSLILGVSEKDSQHILTEILSLARSQEEKVELSKSALGELCNNIACDLAEIDVFKKDFGNLHPTAPLVWVIDGTLPDFIEAEGFSSHIFSENTKVFTFISKYPFQKNSNGDIGANNWNPTRTLSIYDPHGNK
mgnify:CR=1 FL=1